MSSYKIETHSLTTPVDYAIILLKGVQLDILSITCSNKIRLKIMSRPKEKLSIQELSPKEQTVILNQIAHDETKKIIRYQLPNGLIPASVGRYDDRHFADCKVWIKDAVRAVQFALDPDFQQSFPDLVKPAKKLFLSSMQPLLLTQGQPEQLQHFQNRPGPPDQNGYATIDDSAAPAIKFNRDGSIYQDWGHNQPDNWGTLLLVTGKAIEANWPILATPKSTDYPIPLGAILQEVISYAVNLRTERLICRSIWEHNKAWSSYSTRSIVLAGLEQSERVWPEIVEDSKKRGYPLKISSQQIQESSGSLREKTKEHYPADYTDVEGHQSTSDLASMVVANDTKLPKDELEEIMSRAFELENREGFHRYLGDPWKRGRAEAKWTMGKPIMARLYFKKSMGQYESRTAREASRSLCHGLDRINDILDIKRNYGYIPELFEDKDNNGIYKPNNNELAWTLGYVIQAAGAGAMAIRRAEQFYQKAA